MSLLRGPKAPGAGDHELVLQQSASERVRAAGTELLLLQSASCVLLLAAALDGLRVIAFAGTAGTVARAGLHACLPFAAGVWLVDALQATPLWAEHRDGVERQEREALRLITDCASWRLLDGVSLDASTRRLVGAGSGRLFRRLALALAVVDWCLLASLTADVCSPPGVMLTAFLAVDGLRVAVHSLHTRALRTSSNAANGAMRGLFLRMFHASSTLGEAALRMDVLALACTAACVLPLPSVPQAVTTLLALRMARLVMEVPVLVASWTATPSLRASLDSLLVGAAACELPPPVVEPAAVATPGAPAIRLDAFSSLALAGMRGFLRAEEAARALQGLLLEADVDKDGIVSVQDMTAWVRREPADGKDGVSWRASVRRIAAAMMPRDRETVPPLPVSVPVPASAVTGTLTGPPARPRGMRVLSLEGGGIRGLALIWMLQAIEARTGRPIHELFDLVAGSSTGGIVALAVLHRVPLADLEALYFQAADQVFAKSSALRQLMTGAAADSSPLVRMLKDKLGESTPMRGAHSWPAAFVVTTRQHGDEEHTRLDVRIIRTYDSSSPSRGRDARENWLMWEAGVATSAAPTILPPLRRADGSIFVDGALSGNANPSLLACLEALELANGRPIDTVLSLGCGDSGPVVVQPDGDVGKSGTVFWLKQTLSLAFDARLQEERASRLIEQMSPNTRYIRLSPSPMTDIALAEHRHERLERMRAETAAYIQQQGPVFDRLCAILEDDLGDSLAGVPDAPVELSLDGHLQAALLL